MGQTVAEEIVDAIEAYYRTLTGDAVLAFRFGAKHLAAHDVDRRVVFVRVGGRVEAPSRTGGFWMRSGFEGAKARADKVEAVHVHVYDPDPGNCEVTHEQLLVAIQNTLHRAVTIADDYDWVTEQTPRHEHAVEKIVQPMRWRIAIPDARQTLVVINDVTNSASLGGGAFSSAFSNAFSRSGGDPV